MKKGNLYRNCFILTVETNEALGDLLGVSWTNNAADDKIAQRNHQDGHQTQLSLLKTHLNIHSKNYIKYI